MLNHVLTDLNKAGLYFFKSIHKKFLDSIKILFFFIKLCI